jgi:ADP-heptose:LPS heptosyltransferase
MKHYLVIQLARFGDLIQTKRLLATLCARRDARVHLCLDRSLEALARLVFPDVTLHPVTAHGTGLGRTEGLRAMLVDNRRTFSELRAIGFSRIFNLNFSPLNFRMAALFDADIVEGYAWKDGQELIGLWPSMAMRWSDQRRISINLVDFWGAYCPDMIAPERVNPPARPKGGGLGVVLAGRESRRSLPAEILARIVSTAAQTGKTPRIVLLGSGSEQGAGQSIMKLLPPAVQARTENLAGRTDWAALVDVVGSLDLLLTPDTGTMHLAAHLGTPVQAFFLSSAWCFETGPYGEGHTVHQALIPCLPCLESSPCDHGLACLKPFADPGFLRFMTTGKAEHMPDGLISCRTRFDELGLTYEAVAGIDPDATRRDAFRRFILQYLTGKGEGIDELGTLFAQKIYRENDWIARVRRSDTGEA